MSRSQNLPNSVMPRKVYGIWWRHEELGEVIADDVHEAFRIGREKFGANARAAIFKRSTHDKHRPEPMFLSE